MGRFTDRLCIFNFMVTSALLDTDFPAVAPRLYLHHSEPKTLLLDFECAAIEAAADNRLELAGATPADQPKPAEWRETQITNIS